MRYNATDAGGNFTSWGYRGTVVTPTYYWTTTGVAAGDFLGNGTKATVSVIYGSYVAYAPGQALIVYSGTGYDTTTVLTGTTNMSKSVGAIDANFDSRIDWAVSTQPSYLEVWSGTTQASVLTLNAGVGSPGVSSPITGYIASGDLDRDGRDDLVVTTSSWICEGMGSYNGSTYAQGISGDGGSKGFVWYLNTSN